MRIGPDEVARIAVLAALEFDETERVRMAEEMSGVLDYIDQLKTVEAPDERVIDSEPGTPARADLVRESLSMDDFAENAPEMMRGHFVVPRVIGGE